MSNSIVSVPDRCIFIYFVNDVIAGTQTEDLGTEKCLSPMYFFLLAALTRWVGCYSISL